MTTAEYKAALDALDDAAFAAFRRDFGGDFATRQQYVDDFVHHPEHERRICQLLGLATEQEKATLSARHANSIATRSTWFSWVDSRTRVPNSTRGGPMGIIDRHRRLTLWNKVAFWGSVASIVSLAIWLLVPGAGTGQSASVQGDGATVMQAARDVVVNQPTPQKRTLLPQQLRLLELVDQYQRKFAANRLIVSRSDGTLYFEGDPTRAEGISLMKDLFGGASERNAGRLEELIHSIPAEYLRLTPEARWDNPYVVALTEAGAEQIRSR